MVSEITYAKINMFCCLSYKRIVTKIKYFSDRYVLVPETSVQVI